MLILNESFYKADIIKSYSIFNFRRVTFVDFKKDKGTTEIFLVKIILSIFMKALSYGLYSFSFY